MEGMGFQIDVAAGGREVAMGADGADGAAVGCGVGLGAEVLGLLGCLDRC